MRNKVLLDNARLGEWMNAGGLFLLGSAAGQAAVVAGDSPGWGLIVTQAIVALLGIGAGADVHRRATRPGSAPIEKQ